MPILRVASLAMVALWIGGLAVLGLVVAPSIFAVLEQQDPLSGRILAGLVFGDIFARFQRLAWFLGGGLILLLGARALLGPRPRRLGVQVGLVAVMLAASAYGALIITPRIDTLRTGVATTALPAGGMAPVSMAGLPDTDPRKQEFGRLHGLSNGLMMLTLIAGLAVFWIEARE
jgi:hypothetical protein